MQDNFNNEFYQIAQTAALMNISKSLKEMGCTSIKDVDSKIADIEIQIAVLTDQGKDPTALKELLKKYKQIKIDYQTAMQEQEEKTKKIGLFASIGIAIVAVIGTIIVLAVCL